MRRFPEIEELAEAVAESVCPDRPIDPEAIAQDEEITWRYGDYGPGFDGLLVLRPKGFRIICNAKRGTPRSRFTFGHELGHYFIDEHRIAIATQGIHHYSTAGDWHSDQIVEQQADTFAAHLLMPSKRFRSLIGKSQAGLPAVLAAAGKFEVSVTSAAIRFLQTTTTCCVLVMWKPDGTYAWSWGNDAAHAMGLRRCIRELPVPSEDFATAMARAGGHPPSAGFFEKPTTASAWFQNARSDLLLKEQAIKLGDFGVLTLLVPLDLAMLR